MKVKELIAVLQVMPQDQPVFISDIKTDYLGTYIDVQEPKAKFIFQKEGCTILSLDSEVIFDNYVQNDAIWQLKEASSNSKGVKDAS